MGKGKGGKRGALRLVFTVLGWLLASLVLFVAGSIAVFLIERGADLGAQKRRVEAYLVSKPAPSPSLAADLALPDELPLDRLRLLATHNSYRRASGPLHQLYIGLVEPAWPAKLAYSHPDFRTQLDEGLRSLELDLRPRGSAFVLAHVPLVDERSDERDLSLALREIAHWSEANAGHLPLILLLELKDDYAFLDPGLGGWKAEAFDRLDATLRAGLGSRLFAPDELRAGAASLSQALAARGWPKVGALRGRILVVLHQNEKFRALYTSGGRSALEGRAMFDCAPIGSPDGGFAILNDPVADAARIAEARRAKLIVRTRADADLDLDPALLAAALASGAQIVSTDFPPGRAGPKGYVAALPGGRTADSLP